MSMSEHPDQKKAHQRRGFRKLPLWGRLLIFIMGSFIMLLIIAGVGFTWYINANKSTLLRDITGRLSERLEGTLTIEDMEPTIWKNFPSFSIRLENVMLSDTLYPIHKTPLLKVTSLYLQINLRSLLTKHPEIEKITATEGTMHLFTDSSFYSNSYLLKPKETSDKPQKRQLEFDHITLEDFNFISEHHPREKKFEIHINELSTNIRIRNAIWYISAPADLHIQQLGFKLSKGSFLNNTDLKGNLELEFDPNSKDLTIKEKQVKVNGSNVIFGGVFHFADQPTSFSLKINAPSIDYQKAVVLMNKHIQSKLEVVDVKKPLNVYTTIDGRFAYPDTPTVHVRFETKNNRLITSYGVLESATFSGTFLNEVVKGAGHSDHNTKIDIPMLTANWEGIPLKVSAIHVFDLLDPFVEFHVQSQFPVKKLNNIVDKSYAFGSGNAKVDIKYSGPVLPGNISNRMINGNILIQQAAFSYKPRGLNFDHCDINLIFAGNDLFIKNTVLHAKGNELRLEGSAKRFTNLYFSDPQKVLIDWHIQSEQINLNHFIGFLGKRTGTTASPGKTNPHAKIEQFNQQLNQLLESGSMNLAINVKKMIFDKFEGRDIKAHLSLLASGITIQDFHIMHAGGYMDLNGSINQSAPSNPFKVKIKVVNAKVDKLFASFSNFGLKDLTDKNIKGIVSADVNLSGGITDEGRLLPYSYVGSVDFNLQDGKLLDFDPLLKIQKFVFRKRNLDSVVVKPLSGRFDIANGKITIQPMNIETSAININVKGIYGFQGGTDINFEIPMRNPAKDKRRIQKGLAPKTRQGIIIYLRATDGEDGKLKIGWDPAKKGWRGNDADDDFEDDDVEDDLGKTGNVFRENKEKELSEPTEAARPKKRFSILNRNGKSSGK